MQLTEIELWIFAFTFVYGVLRFVSLLKIFGNYLTNFFQGIFGIENKNRTVAGGFIVWLDNAIFYGSLIYQAYFWIKFILA